MKLNRKWILVMSLVLSVAMAVSGTLAYMTDTDTKTNTFTLGNVDISLSEPNWTDNSVIGPGVTVAKDPTITNNGRTDAYVWLTVDVPNAIFEYIDFGTLGSGWTKDEGTKGEETTTVVFKYNANEDNNKLASNASTSAAFSNVTLSKDIPSDTFNNLADTFDMVVNAYAIEANSSFAEFDAAYNAFKGDESGAANGDDDSITYSIPENAVRVNSVDDLLTNINNGQTIFVLENGSYDLYSLNGKSVTIYGESKTGTIIKLSNEGEYGMDYAFDGASAHFYGLTIDTTEMGTNSSGQDPTWPGYARLQNATYNDCIINGSYCPVAGTHTFNYTTFNITGNNYNTWIYGANTVKFDHCTFNCNIKAIYADGAGGINLTVENCLFNDTDTTQGDKAAIETGFTYTGNNKITLNVNNTTVNGFSAGKNTSSTLWANKDNKNADQLSVTIDGTTVQ